MSGVCLGPFQKPLKILAKSQAKKNYLMSFVLFFFFLMKLKSETQSMVFTMKPSSPTQYKNVLSNQRRKIGKVYLWIENSVCTAVTLHFILSLDPEPRQIRQHSLASYDTTACGEQRVRPACLKQRLHQNDSTRVTISLKLLRLLTHLHLNSFLVGYVIRNLLLLPEILQSSHWVGAHIRWWPTV